MLVENYDKTKAYTKRLKKTGGVEMQFIKQYMGLPKEIYILFLATIVNRMGDFIYPFMTLFLKSKIGLGTDEIGRIMVWSTITYMLAVAVGGKIADYFNRKKVYIICTLTSIVIIIGCGFMKENMNMVYVLIISQIFLRLGSPAMDAMKMDLTKSDNRKSSFSLIYLGINVGVAIGPLIAGALFANHIKILFFGDALSSIIALMLIILYIKDEKTEEPVIKQEIVKTEVDLERAEEGSVFKVLSKRPALIIFSCICGALSFTYAQGGFTLPLHLEQIYEAARGSRYYGYLMTLNAITVVVTTPFILSVTKKYSALTNIMFASICYAVGFGMYGIIVNGAGFIVGTILWTLGEILATTNTGVYIADHSPSSHRARFQSVHTIITSVGKILAPMVMGEYLVGHSIVSGWYIVGAVSIITACFIALDICCSKYKNKSISVNN